MARVVHWSCGLTILLVAICLTAIESKRLGGGGRRTWGSVSKPRPTYTHKPSAPPQPSYKPTSNVGWNTGGSKPSAPSGHPESTINRDIGWNVGSRQPQPGGSGNIGWNVGNTGQNTGNIGWKPGQNAGAPPPYPGHTATHGTNLGAPPPYPGHAGTHGSNPGAPPPYPGYPGSHGSNAGAPPPYPGYPGSHGAPPPYPGYPGHNTHGGAPPPYPGYGSYPGQTHYTPNTHYPGGYGGYPSQPMYSGGFPVGGGFGGYPGGFGGGYGGHGGYGGFGGLGGMAGIASGYSGYKKSSGISASTAISGALLGLTLWNLARDHNHYHVYYPNSYNSNAPRPGNTVSSTDNLSPGQASISSYIGNMTCITVYDARAVQRWANRTLEDFHKAYPKTPFPGAGNTTEAYNFTVVPGEVIHRERMVMTCCATAGDPVKLTYLSSGKLSDVNCLQQAYTMPFRKLKFIPINSTSSQNDTSSSNTTQPATATNSTEVPVTNSTESISSANVTTLETNSTAPTSGNVTLLNPESSNQNTSSEPTAGTTVNNIEVTTIKT